MTEPQDFIELQTPTFEIFNSFLGEKIFDKIKTGWLNKKHYYLGKEGDEVTNFECEDADTITGFDIPVLIRKNDGNNVVDKKLMIIVGESPLREGSEPKFLVGFPFAVDYERKKPSQCYVYKELFNKLLDEDYDLYITDIIKVWSGGSKNKKFNVTELDRELEILSEKYNKIHILLMGKNAQKWKMSNKVGNCEITKIEIPHMSQQNWDTWRIKIYEDAFRRLINEGKITQEENIEGLLECTADGIKFKPMNAEIVVKTALKMIGANE